MIIYEIVIQDVPTESVGDGSKVRATVGPGMAFSFEKQEGQVVDGALSMAVNTSTRGGVTFSETMAATMVKAALEAASEMLGEIAGAKQTFAGPGMKQQVAAVVREARERPET